MKSPVITTLNTEQLTTEQVTITKPLQLISALLLGGAILYAAAFVQTPAVHNAAHDMRHSQGFPCH